MASMLQQFNKRFTPAFAGMRNAFSAAAKQGLYRYQEQVLAGKAKVLAHIVRVVGVEDGYRVISLLRDPNFDEGVIVELTAASASVNKEADRQATFQLVGLLAQYYQKVIELATIAANPQAPPVVGEIAKDVAEAMGELVERTLRTFDQVRDPALFVIEMGDKIDEAIGDRPRQALMQVLGPAAMQGAGEGAQPEGPQVMDGGQGG